MVKRKITQYYRATKKAKNGVQVRNTRRAAPKNRRRRVTIKRTRRRIPKKKRKTNTKTTLGNVKTYLVENADICVVPTASVGGGSDYIGQRCAYFAPGCSTSSTITAPGNCLALNGIQAIVNMADIIRKAEQDSGSPGVTGETKYIIKNSSQVYQLVNQSNSIATITAYYCVAQRDVMADSASSSPQRDPVFILSDGFYQRGETTGTGLAPIVGKQNPQLNDTLLSPFDSHRFCSFFKIFKTETYQMDPGMNKSHILKSSNKFINYDHYTQFQNNAYQGGTETYAVQYTHRKGEQFIMFKVTGQPSDFNNEQLTFTSPKIDMITKTHYNFQSISRQQPIIYRDFAVGFQQKATTTTVPTIMVDESGVPATATNA